MFDEKTILARLQNGEDAQKIADEMAAMINAANKTYAEQKAAEEAAKAEAEHEVQKKEELQEILDLFADWMNAYYGIEAKGELNADQVLEMIDSIKEYVEALKDFEKAFGMKTRAKLSNKIDKTASADETINQFLSQMGW
jgi:uncharacterized protein YyaL (SSP411 family)